MNRFLRFTATAVISFAIYLLLAASLGVWEILFGACAALVAATIVGKFLPMRMTALNPVRIAKAIAYAPFFLWKMIEANVRLAVIVIRPSLPVHPSIVRAATSLATPQGKLLLTSSITLTPGTLTVDVDDDQIYVHCVSPNHEELADPKQTILAPFEKRLRGVTE